MFNNNFNFKEKSEKKGRFMDLLNFLNDSVTPWHAAANLAKELQSQGFVQLMEAEPWTLSQNAAYFVQRGAAIFAFRTPVKWTSETRFRLASAHTDFPALKLTPNPDKNVAGIHLLHPEVYGGALINTWFDRDLGVAGIAVVQNRGKLEKRLVRMNTLCRVPELAIHLNRGVNDTGFQVNAQNHLNVCFSGTASKLFVTSLEEEVGAKIVDFDMQFFDAQPATFGGFSKEWIYSGRLDNLLSCEAILNGIVSQSNESEHVRCAFFFDNEEVGSETRTGASGNFAEAMLERVALSGGVLHGELLGKLSDSILFSLDVAHATHPAYVEKMEPNHSPVLGKGIVLKANAKKRYASEAESNALVKLLCQQNEIPLQTFVSRNDMPCGSTVGPRLSAELGIPTVDLGEAILSMHSIREMSAIADHTGMQKLMCAFYKV